MTHVVKLAGRALPLLAFALALGACESVDPTDPLGSSADPVAVLGVTSKTPTLARSSFGGGIPFGVFNLPMSMYGAPYSSSLVNTASSTSSLLPYLEAARQSGTRVVLSFVGAENNYKNSNGTFSLDKWKKRVDAYRGINFSSYIADGTIIGHYILDEPHDASNWAGHTVSQATVDEMARYSKSIWPAMPTIIRGWPAYLKGYQYRDLDAALAQYSDRFGSVSAFISDNVRDAKASGLALVVGLNQLAGGSKNGLKGFVDGKNAMNADELESWGRALLSEPYVCAFLSWAYDSKYMSRSDIKQAMTSLAQTAGKQSNRSCRGANGQTTAIVTEPAPPVTPPPPPPVTTDSVPPVPADSQPTVPADSQPTAPPPPVTGNGTPTAIVVNVTGWSQNGRHYMKLTWSGATGSSVDVFRNGTQKKNTENDKKYVNVLPTTRAATYVYKVCEKNSSNCSKSVSVSVK